MIVDSAYETAQTDVLRAERVDTLVARGWVRLSAVDGHLRSRSVELCGFVPIQRAGAFREPWAPP